MVSFLKKLKREGIPTEPEQKDAEISSGEVLQGVAQLDVDVFQSSNEIVIYSQIPGTDIEEVDVSIEGDNDVITIKANRKRPETAAYGDNVPDGKYFSEECVWGEGYRQIILPEEVDVNHAEAKFKNGVLILILPLKRSSEKKTKVKILKLDS